MTFDPCNVILGTYVDSFDLVDMSRHTVFSLDITIFHFSAHLTMVSNEFCVLLSASSIVVPCESSATSSANSVVTESLMLSVMSFMNIKNRIGDSTDPCGSPSENRFCLLLLLPNLVPRANFPFLIFSDDATIGPGIG